MTPPHEWTSADIAQHSARTDVDRERAESPVERVICRERFSLNRFERERNIYGDPRADIAQHVRQTEDRDWTVQDFADHIADLDDGWDRYETQHARHRETPDQRARRLEGCTALAERVGRIDANLARGRIPQKRSIWTPFARFIVALCGFLLAAWAAVALLA